MQDILIPSTKRISYFFGWDDRSDKMPQQLQVGDTTTLKASYWKVAKWVQFILSKIGMKTIGHGISLGHDFDIMCYVFDKDKKLVEIVAPDNVKDINASGSIYHSGDDKDGQNGPYDEELSMELSKIPSTSHSIIIYVRNDSDIQATPHINAKLRLMNMTDHQEYFTHDITFAGHNEHGFIVSRLAKLGSSWRHDFIDEYSFEHPDGKESEFFARFLK